MVSAKRTAPSSIRRWPMERRCLGPISAPSVFLTPKSLPRALKEELANRKPNNPPKRNTTPLSKNKNAVNVFRIFPCIRYDNKDTTSATAFVKPISVR